MIFYRKDYRILSGIIQEVQNSMVKVEFIEQKSRKTVNIPKNIIRSNIRLEIGIQQNFEIPAWFLKRNRIIPLNEGLP